MADRDWDRELAKIDKRLESVSDEALLREPAAPAATGPRGAGPSQPGAGRDLAAARERTTTWPALLRLLLAVTLGVAMLFWPYEARCGLGLAAYLGAVGVVVVAGVWSAVWTWRHRAGAAHVLSLLIVTWGLVLGAQEVLPRTGYAKPTLAHPAIWSCG